MSDEHHEVLALRDELRRLLAAALQTDVDHAAEIDLLKEQFAEELSVALEESDFDHAAEMNHLRAEHAQDLKDYEEQSESDHAAAIVGLEHQHADVVRHFNRALESRDVIGQAKGVLMATFGCSADAAFALLARQSQAENRKLHDVATTIAAQAVRESNPGGP